MWTWTAIITSSITVIASSGYFFGQPTLTKTFEYSIMLFLAGGFIHMFLNGTIIGKPRFFIPIVLAGLLPLIIMTLGVSVHLTPLLLFGLNEGTQVLIILIYFLHYRQKQSKTRLDHLKLIWLFSTQLLNIIGYQIVILHWPGEELLYSIEITLSVLLVLYFYGDGIMNSSWLKKE